MAFIYAAATSGTVAVPALIHSFILQYFQLKNVVIVSVDVNFPLNSLFYHIAVSRSVQSTSHLISTKR